MEEHHKGDSLGGKHDEHRGSLSLRVLVNDTNNAREWHVLLGEIVWHVLSSQNTTRCQIEIHGLIKSYTCLKCYYCFC